jgi:hypothetical protein
MGLNPNHRRVIHSKKSDEEQRFRAITEKRHSISQVEKVDSGSE